MSVYSAGAVRDFETGLDLAGTGCEASHWLAGVMGKELPSKLADAWGAA
jgi:hypothetical protein